MTGHCRSRQGRYETWRPGIDLLHEAESMWKVHFTVAEFSLFQWSAGAPRWLLVEGKSECRMHRNVYVVHCDKQRQR